MVFAKVLMSADLPVWWGSRHSKRMGNALTSINVALSAHQGRFQGH